MLKFSSKSHEYRLALAEHFIEVLNSALIADTKAVRNLVEHRVPCNKALADHPTIQAVVERVSTTSGAATLVDKYTVGMLGILNGLIGVDVNAQGYVQAIFDGNDATHLVTFALNPIVSSIAK